MSTYLLKPTWKCDRCNKYYMEKSRHLRGCYACKGEDLKCNMKFCYTYGHHFHPDCHCTRACYMCLKEDDQCDLYRCNKCKLYACSYHIDIACANEDGIEMECNKCNPDHLCYKMGCECARNSCWERNGGNMQDGPVDVDFESYLKQELPDDSDCSLSECSEMDIDYATHYIIANEGVCYYIVDVEKCCPNDLFVYANNITEAYQKFTNYFENIKSKSAIDSNPNSDSNPK